MGDPVQIRVKIIKRGLEYIDDGAKWTARLDPT